MMNKLSIFGFSAVGQTKQGFWEIVMCIFYLFSDILQTKRLITGVREQFAD